MLNYKSNNMHGFKAVLVNVPKIAAIFKDDGYPNHIGFEAECPEHLPLVLLQNHADSYWKRYSEIDVEQVITRPLLRLSTAEERSEYGWGALQLLDGRHRIAVSRDLGLDTIEIEVPWNEVERIEALFS